MLVSTAIIQIVASPREATEADEAFATDTLDHGPAAGAGFGSGMLGTEGDRDVGAFGEV
jgi:hypothetical protein